MKRWLFVVIIAMLLACLSGTALAAYWDGLYPSPSDNSFNPKASITTGTTYDVEITASNKARAYSFMPTTSGVYSIESFGDADTYAYLYDDQYNLLADDDDGDGDAGTNFRLTYELEGGVTYYYYLTTYYEPAAYTFKLSLAEVSGDGFIYKYYDYNKTARVTGYFGSDSDVYIPAKTMRNGTEYSVTMIATNAFNKYSALQSVTLPEGIFFVSNSAFYRCNNLETISLSSTVEMAPGAISECPALQNIIMAQDNLYHSVQDGVLFDKDKTTLYCYPAMKAGSSYSVPSTVTRVASEAFSFAGNLTSISLNNVTDIGWHAFYGSSLTSLQIPAGYETDIDNGIFAGLEKLTNITVAPENTMFFVGNNALFANRFKDHQVSLVKYFGNADDVDLTNIQPAGREIYEIDSYAFEGRQNLVTLRLSDGVGFVYEKVIVNCPELTDVYFNEDVRSIPNSFAIGCPKFVNVHGFDGTTAERYAKNTRKNYDSLGTTFYDILVLNQELTVTQTGEAKLGFTPETSGLYIFQATTESNEVYGWANLYNEDGEYITYDGGTGDYLFYISYYLEANKQYALVCDCNTEAVNPNAANYSVKVVQPVGTGDYRYSLDSQGRATIVKYQGNAGAVEVPVSIDGHPVTRIAGNAFSDNSTITSITLQEGIIGLSLDAINSLSNLTTVSLPASLADLDGSFRDCPSLTTINLNPDNNFLESDTDGILYSKGKDRLYCIPAGLNIATYTAPESLWDIAEYAIYGNRYLKMVDLSPAVYLEYLYSNLIGLTGLETIKLPENLDSIDYSVLDRCGSDFIVWVYEGSVAATFAEDKVPGDRIEYIDAIYTYAELGDNPVPGGRRRFSFTPGDDGVYWIRGDELEPWIGQECTVKDANGNEIGRSDYDDDTSFSMYVGLNAGVTYTILCDSEDLEDYTMVLSKTDGEVADGGFVLVLNEAKTAYKLVAYQGNAAEVVIPRAHNRLPVTEIGSYLFTGPVITSITVPGTVTDIENGLCEDCPNLVELNLGDDIEFIGSAVVWDCPKLTSVTLPASVDLKGNPFVNCSSLETINVHPNSVHLKSVDGVVYSKDGVRDWLCIYPTTKTSSQFSVPEGVAYIGGYAFDGASQLTQITLPNTLYNIYYSAFSNCTSLQSITIPSNVASIGSAAFENCSNLESVTLNEGLISLYFGAFYNCSSLMKLKIPRSVTFMTRLGELPSDFVLTVYKGSYAYEWAIEAGYEENVNLEVIDYDAGITPDGLWYTIVDGVAVITGYSGTNDEVFIPSLVEHNERHYPATTIADEAFKGCTIIKRAIILPYVTSIGENAFADCDEYLVIHGFRNTAAQTYAESNGIPFSRMFYLGDVNWDDLVNQADVMMVLNHISGLEPITDRDALMRADAYGNDSIINNRDAVKIYQMAAGK